MKKKLIKLMDFLESYGLIIILSLLIIKMFMYPTFNLLNSNLIIKNLKYIVINKTDILLNLSGVFIGIYFAMLLLFTSYNKNTTLYNLKDKSFSKLIRFLVSGVVACFLYMFLALFTDVKSNTSWMIIIFIYMMGSLLRFGIFLVIWQVKDIKNYRKKMKNDIDVETQLNIMNQNIRDISELLKEK